MHMLRKPLVLPAQESQRGHKNHVKALSERKEAGSDNEEAFLIPPSGCTAGVPSEVHNLVLPNKAAAAGAAGAVAQSWHHLLLHLQTYSNQALHRLPL